MATKYSFDNKSITLPGAYSTIKSAIDNPPVTANYGRVLVIDNGVGASFGGGSGIDGELANGLDAIYRFQSLAQYQSFLAGGMFWKTAEALFKPGLSSAILGASEVLHVKAATTVCAEMIFAATGGGAAGGSFKVKPRQEGLSANGNPLETRAQSTATVTNAGATASKITVKVSGIKVAEYTNLNSDNIATMVAGLASSATALGICTVVTSVSPALVFKAPVGYGATTITPTIEVTGTATATTVAFAGGVTASVLASGYAYTIASGVKDTAKWIMKIWRGSWKGNYTDGIAYDEIAQADTKAELVIRSPEFNNIQDLLTWGATPQFNQHFYMDPTSTKIGTGAVTTPDVSVLSGYQVASGGTETYSTTNLDLILEAVKDVDYNFLLSDQYGTSNYDSASSSKMFVHLRDQAQFMKFMIVGGGADQDEFDAADGSIDMAQYFNNIHAVVIHSNVKKTSQSAPDGFRYWNTLIHAAYVTGRLAGLEPQVPVTNKALNIDGVVHPMTDTQKEAALEAGVLCTNYNQYSNTFNVVQGINTLQNNTYLINSDATSFSVQMMRIVSQVNRTLVVNANTELLLDERGVNMNTLSAGSLVNWTKNQLQNLVASQDRDNLIISYQNVVVTRNQDSYFVSYEIVVNGEITKIFFTGFMI